MHINEDVVSAIDDFIIKGGDFNYSHFRNQTKRLRSFLVDQIGSKAVAKMSDRDVFNWLQDEGYVPVHICYQNDVDRELTILIPINDLLKYIRIYK